MITRKYLALALAALAFGFNATYALWIIRAQKHPEHLDFALRGVKILDDYLAIPAYILLLVSGLAMVLLAGYNLLTTFWLITALVFWLVVIVLGYAVYTPALSRQIRVLATAGAESAEFHKLSNREAAVGITLAVLVLLILVMMVFKPTL